MVKMNFKKGLFLDRDGVVNRSIIRNGKPYAPLDLEDLEILPDVPIAMSILNQLDIEIVIVSNQPDFATGELAENEHHAITSEIMQITGIKHFYYCLHLDSSKCPCRKPKPGLLYKAAIELGISLEKSFLVGDRWRDIGAGNAAGCRNFYIQNDYLESDPGLPYIAVSSLHEAALEIERMIYETKD